MEIEKKYLLKTLPEDLEDYPYHEIEQAYLCTSPVVRVRKEDDNYYLTYKGSGMMIREEANLPLTKEAYEHLVCKHDGNIISKRRYLLPLADDSDLIIELDRFYGRYDGLYLAEVEFPDEESAKAFVPPAWFAEDVTFNEKYHNSYLSVAKDIDDGEEK